MSRYTILGVGVAAWLLMCWFCIPHDGHHMEHDIMGRSMSLFEKNHLAANGLTVDGRDVTLTGYAGTPEVSDGAVKLVSAMWGVRSVRTNILTRPEPAKPVVTAVQADAAAKSISKILTLRNVEFYTGTEKLTPGGRGTLNQVAGVLGQYPSMAVEIAGHTDSMGDAAMNMDLSKRRAAAVKEYLVAKGIAAGNLSDVGFGQTKPVASNETAAGRQANRRVEFHTKETK